MGRPRGMDPAYYKFIYVPVCAILGIFLVSEFVKAFIPNTFFRYFLITGGLLTAFAVYFKDQLKSFAK